MGQGITLTQATITIITDRGIITTGLTIIGIGITDIIGTGTTGIIGIDARSNGTDPPRRTLGRAKARPYRSISETGFRPFLIRSAFL
jgi:hypothetical protein